MIVIDDVHLHFGGIRAVDGTSFTVEQGSITGLIGPNGAGKTALFNVIAGHYKPTSGRVYMDGDDITGLPPHVLFGRGLLRTFQIAHEFFSLTVRDNLMMVPDGQSGESLVDTWLFPARVRAEEQRVRERAEEIMDFLEIAHLANEPAGELSGGQKKLLELGRTMMVDARIVLLDEAGAGVNRTLLATIVRSIRKLQEDHGYTFCIIEHDMDVIARLCDPVVVMTEGKVLTQGRADEVMSDERVIEAYLGSAHEYGMWAEEIEL